MERFKPRNVDFRKLRVQADNVLNFTAAESLRAAAVMHQRLNEDFVNQTQWGLRKLFGFSVIV